MNFSSLWLAGGALSAAVLATSAFAQSNAGGCQAEALQDPPRTVLTCPNGVRIVAEDGTTFELQDRSSAAGPEAVTLDGKALLARSAGRRRRGRLRGDHTAGDRRGARDQVGGRRGRRARPRYSSSPGVSPSAASPVHPSVELGPGEGVDVEAGTAPLTVKKWGAPRVGGAACPLRRIVLDGPPGAADACSGAAGGPVGGLPRFGASQRRALVPRSRRGDHGRPAHTRPRCPQTARGRADRRDRRRNGAPGRQISTQPRHACAHRRRGREIVAESRGARHSASRHRRRSGRYGADRGAGPQRQRDCGRRSVRRSQTDCRRRWRRSARARACGRQFRLAARPFFAKGLRSASSTYRPTMPARRASFPWSFDPATASRPRFRCRRRRLR